MSCECEEEGIRIVWSLCTFMFHVYLFCFILKSIFDTHTCCPAKKSASYTTIVTVFESLGTWNDGKCSSHTDNSNKETNNLETKSKHTNTHMHIHTLTISLPPPPPFPHFLNLARSGESSLPAHSTTHLGWESFPAHVRNDVHRDHRQKFWRKGLKIRCCSCASVWAVDCISVWVCEWGVGVWVGERDWGRGRDVCVCA